MESLPRSRDPHLLHRQGLHFELAVQARPRVADFRRSTFQLRQVGLSFLFWSWRRQLSVKSYN